MTDIHTNITIPTTKVKESRLSQLDLANIKFGHVFTDHMFVVDYDNGEWINPQIQPFGPIQMHPATSSIHYGQSIFEGMKAHRNKEGEIVFFRMDDHAVVCYSKAQQCLNPKDFRKGIMDLKLTGINLKKATLYISDPTCLQQTSLLGYVDRATISLWSF